MHVHGEFSDPPSAMQKRKAEAEVDAATEDAPSDMPACRNTGAPPGATDGHKAAGEEEGEAHSHLAPNAVAA